MQQKKSSTSFEMLKAQPWIGEPLTDIIFILSPPFLCLLAIVCFPAVFQNNGDMSDSWWVVMILLVDVGHVYSTLYRTYFNLKAYNKFKTLLIYIPVLSFAFGAVIYSISDIWFWRLLAYLAVYHFVRQQYGFMRLYGRKEKMPVWSQHIDQFIIYYATIYPMLYWHLGEERNFNWFVENEFVHFSAQGLLAFFSVAYWLAVAAYLAKEAYVLIRFNIINIPKIALVAGTLISWYFGIIYFNGDMSFTLLNVISHGIPYMALVWLVSKKETSETTSERYLSLFFGKFGIVFFLGLIFLLAYIEEGVWDLVVWNEHKNVFNIFHQFSFTADRTLLALVVPLLALPQITHYVIDGFIWRKSKEY